MEFLLKRDSSKDPKKLSMKGYGALKGIFFPLIFPLFFSVIPFLSFLKKKKRIVKGGHLFSEVVHLFSFSKKKHRRTYLSFQVKKKEEVEEETGVSYPVHAFFPAFRRIICPDE